MERRTYCSNHTTSSRVWRPWYRAHERTSSGIPLDDEAQTGFRYRGQWVSALWWPTARDWRSDRAPCHRSNSRPPQGARWHRTTRARTANPDPCELSRKAIVSQVPITHWRQFHLRSNECRQRAAHQTSEHCPGEVSQPGPCSQRLLCTRSSNPVRAVLILLSNRQHAVRFPYVPSRPSRSWLSTT